MLPLSVRFAEIGKVVIVTVNSRRFHLLIRGPSFLIEDVTNNLLAATAAGRFLNGVAAGAGWVEVQGGDNLAISTGVFGAGDAITPYKFVGSQVAFLGLGSFHPGHDRGQRERPVGSTLLSECGPAKQESRQGEF